MDEKNLDMNTDTLLEPEQTVAEMQEPANTEPEQTAAEMQEPADTEPEEVTPEEPVLPSQKPSPEMKNTRTLGVGEWMITILLYLIPVINIIMMAIWAFSSRGNVHRRNLSRACLLWIILLLLGFVVAITVAGYSILDIVDVLR